MYVVIDDCDQSGGQSYCKYRLHEDILLVRIAIHHHEIVSENNEDILQHHVLYWIHHISFAVQKDQIH